MNYTGAGLATNVSLYPNPAVNVVNIAFGSAMNDVSVYVYNNMGLKVLGLDNLSGSTIQIDMLLMKKGCISLRSAMKKGISISKIFKN